MAQANLLEPVSIFEDLSAPEPFGPRLSKKRRTAIKGAIVELLNLIGPVGKAVISDGGRTPMEKAFETLKKRERFVPLPGIERLDFKLAVKPLDRLRSDDDHRAALYALLRLRVAQLTADEAKKDGLTIPLAVMLALHRKEGNLDIPLSYGVFPLGATPDSLTRPDWAIVDLFLGRHHTFHIERALGSAHDDFAQGIRKMVVSRPALLVGLSRLKEKGHDALDWLRSGEEGAMTAYLLMLAGLDVYTTGSIDPPNHPRYPLQAGVFAYHYARSRLGFDPKRDFMTENAIGLNFYRRITGADRNSLINGELPNFGLVTALCPATKETHRHVLPLSPTDFTAAILREGAFLLEGLRSMPTMNGGLRFDPPLPYVLAYLRYHGGDIKFLLLILDLLYAIAHKKFVSKEQSVQKLAAALSPFHEKLRPEVWRVLKRWQNETEATNFLKTEPVQKRDRAYREAVMQDLQSGSTSLIGPTLMGFMAELNAKGDMNAWEPLMLSLNQNEGWTLLAAALTAPIGKENRPWLGHSRTGFLDPIGLNVLRFHYILRGYEEAFH